MGETPSELGVHWRLIDPGKETPGLKLSNTFGVKNFLQTFAVTPC